MQDRSLSQDPVAALVAAMPVRAAGFIVTLYGDAVVPRGGEVWIGTLIEICARVGISETLVRTAVSRLVAAAQLEGRRLGRRGFYRLSDAASGEFDAAAQLIYGPPQTSGWRFVVIPEEDSEARMAALEKDGFARLRATLALGPARGETPAGCVVFDAQAVGALDLVPAFAAQAWDLDFHARAYRRFVALFAPFEEADMTPDAALTVRLLLVHAWRAALMRDPRLPAEALPSGWPGHAARALFGRLYRVLSKAADSAISAQFQGPDGPLVKHSPALLARQALLDTWSNYDESRHLAPQEEP